MAYRKTTRQLQGEISLNGGQLKLLMAIDENKSMDQMASETGLDKHALQKTLATLVELGLIESVQSDGPFLDRKFLHILKLNLAKVLGPMAEFLIEDAAANMGTSMANIPVGRVAELIIVLAREIPDKAAGDAFKKSIIPLIPKPK